MKIRKTRLPEIIDIISHQTIRSQEELSKQLAVRGYIITQATLSRDLKLIKATKMPDENGVCRYMVGPASTMRSQSKSHSRHPSAHSAVLSVAITGNLVVVKTRNGYASGLAYEIDMLESPLIIGTISGADTVFAAVAEGVTHSQVFDLLSTLLPESVMDAARALFLSHD
ncbi:MAG: arginine repressor [Muribaculaceae bacterium]|nr:arginine repressor [Muribaculaceae bacterium]